MNKNISTPDRIIRIVLALLFAVLYITHMVTGTAGIVLLLLGGIFLATALLNFCPIYKILGISSIKKSEK